MPSLRGTLNSIESIVTDNVKILSNVNVAPDKVKEVVCDFFRCGNSPACKGCLQEEETVDECRLIYLDKIEQRPMKIWAPSFDEVLVRDKKAAANEGRFGLSCNSCYIADRCPEHKQDSMCAYDWGVKEAVQPKEGIDKLIMLQMKRVNRLMLIEEYDGGVADLNLSNEMDRLVRLYQARADIDMIKVNISASASIPGESKPSILNSIFGSLMKKPEQQVPAPVPQQQLPEAYTEAIVINETPNKQTVPAGGLKRKKNAQPD